MIKADIIAILCAIAGAIFVTISFRNYSKGHMDKAIYWLIWVGIVIHGLI